MQLATLTYQRYLRSHGYSRHFWAWVRNKLIRFYADPSCRMLVHDKMLEMPLSHALPYYLQKFPFYDALPVRLSHFIRDTAHFLKCVDIGANIGDTIAAVSPCDTDSILAIEPNPKFSAYLRRNWEKTGKVEILNVLCSSSNKVELYTIKEKVGTASIVRDSNGILIQTMTLDDIIAQNKAFSHANFLKIDTDGNDFEVINGAKDTIRQNLPAVLFECDVFSNPSYLQDCLNTLLFFKHSGYESFLVYDNYGYLMGKHTFANLVSFQNLLFYQLTSKFYYFDILIMREQDCSKFLDLERSYFANQISDESQKRMVQESYLV